MLYERFGTVTLPSLDGEQDVGTADSRSGLMDLPIGGAFDSYGSGQAPRQSQVIALRGVLIATDGANLQAQEDALRATRGKRDKLYARTGDNLVRWTWARVLGLSEIRRRYLALEVAFRMELLSPVWYGSRHGDGWTFDSGEFFDTGLVFDEATGDVFTLTAALASYIVTNSGNAINRNAVFTITAPGGSTVTNLVIKVIPVDTTLASHLVYAGTLVASQSLVIDAGSQGITNNGLADYANLSFGVTHAISGWIVLGPGANTVQISYTGSNGATLLTAFSDSFE